MASPRFSGRFRAASTLVLIDASSRFAHPGDNANAALASINETFFLITSTPLCCVVLLHPSETRDVQAGETVPPPTERNACDRLSKPLSLTRAHAGKKIFVYIVYAAPEKSVRAGKTLPADRLTGGAGATPVNDLFIPS